MLLAHPLALSASQHVHKKKSLRVYTSMPSGGVELTKLPYTRLEDNLICRRGDRYDDPPTHNPHEYRHNKKRWRTASYSYCSFSLCYGSLRVCVGLGKTSFAGRGSSPVELAPALRVSSAEVPSAAAFPGGNDRDVVLTFLTSLSCSSFFIQGFTGAAGQMTALDRYFN